MAVSEAVEDTATPCCKGKRGPGMPDQRDLQEGGWQSSMLAELRILQTADGCRAGKQAGVQEEEEGNWRRIRGWAQEWSPGLSQASHRL